jgi:hypothetical protein
MRKIDANFDMHTKIFNKLKNHSIRKDKTEHELKNKSFIESNFVVDSGTKLI